jgi:hypothetical protein
MGWLPRPPESRLHARRAWTAPGLGDARTDDLSYVVVDEIVGTSVGIALSAWPTLDDKGRLRFSEGAPKTLGADRLALESFLADHRLPRELAGRPLRIGDVFAVRTIESALARVEEELAGPSRLQPFLAPETWIEPPVYDVTPDAREAAKTSFYSAVAPILAPTEAALLDEIVERAPEVPPLHAPPPQPRPWFRRNLPWLAATTVLVAGGIAAGAAIGGDSGGSTGTVTVTEGRTDVQTTTETATTTVSETATEVSTTTQTTATTETVATTVATTETVATTVATTETVTTTITVTTTPPPPIG